MLKDSWATTGILTISLKRSIVIVPRLVRVLSIVPEKLSACPSHPETPQGSLAPHHPGYIKNRSEENPKQEKFSTQSYNQTCPSYWLPFSYAIVVEKSLK